MTESNTPKLNSSRVKILWPYFENGYTIAYTSAQTKIARGTVGKYFKVWSNKLIDEVYDDWIITQKLAKARGLIALDILLGSLKELSTPKTIKNWTVKKGYFGENFIAQVTPNPDIDAIILCTTLKGRKNYARIEDFHMIYKNWEGYLLGRIPRQEFAKRTFVTKYVISIIHQYIE